MTPKQIDHAASLPDRPGETYAATSERHDWLDKPGNLLPHTEDSNKVEGAKRAAEEELSTGSRSRWVLSKFNIPREGIVCSQRELDFDLVYKGLAEEGASCQESCKERAKRLCWRLVRLLLSLSSNEQFVRRGKASVL